MFVFILGRAAFIGLGFGDRSDSFDLNVALQDHFKWLKKEKEAEHAPPRAEQDFSFKEGETIKINMRITKKDGSEGSSKAKSRPSPGAGGALLPPPPGGLRIPPPSPQHTPMSVTPTNSATQASDWGDYNSARYPISIYSTHNENKHSFMFIFSAATLLRIILQLHRPPTVIGSSFKFCSHQPLCDVVVYKLNIS